MKKTLMAVKCKDGWAVEIKIACTAITEKGVRDLIAYEGLDLRSELKDPDSGEVVSIYAD